MNPADWIIIALVLVNVVVAAVQGFFAEAFSLAGLVVGYMVAAWQYQGLSAISPFFKNVPSQLDNPWYCQAATM